MSSNTPDEPLLAAGEKPAPRPDFNGQLLQLPGDHAVYLIDHGYKRHIPHPDALRAVFVDQPRIVPFDITIFPTSFDFYVMPILVTVAEGWVGDNAVYLLDCDPSSPYVKPRARKIVSEDVFNRYQFSWNKIHRAHGTIMAVMERGMDVVGPP